MRFGQQLQESILDCILCADFCNIMFWSAQVWTDQREGLCCLKLWSCYVQSCYDWWLTSILHTSKALWLDWKVQPCRQTLLLLLSSLLVVISALRSWTFIYVAPVFSMAQICCWRCAQVSEETPMTHPTVEANQWAKQHFVFDDNNQGVRLTIILKNTCQIFCAMWILCIRCIGDPNWGTNGQCCYWCMITLHCMEMYWHKPTYTVSRYTRKVSAILHCATFLFTAYIQIYSSF